MRDYIFVEKSLERTGGTQGGLQSPWRKVKVVRETPTDVYVLKRDAGAEYAEECAQLRVDRQCLEGTGEYRHPATGIAFRLWPVRFSCRGCSPTRRAGIGFWDSEQGLRAPDEVPACSTDRPLTGKTMEDHILGMTPQTLVALEQEILWARCLNRDHVWFDNVELHFGDAALLYSFAKGEIKRNAWRHDKPTEE